MKKYLILFLLLMTPFALYASGAVSGEPIFPPALSSYDNPNLSGLGEILAYRISVEPLNLIVSLIFLTAILHTFMAGKFISIAHHWEEEHGEHVSVHGVHHNYSGEVVPEVHFGAELFHFLGEVEVVFGMWALATMGAIMYYHNVHAVTDYINSVNFTEPMFVVVIMAIAATRPVVSLSEQMLQKVANLGKGTPAAWWFTILTIGPLLGSFITEPAAMTISALLLSNRFYHYRPKPRFAYGTIGLLFVNISVGGTLSHFAAPPVLMVASKWNWDFNFMFTNYGWKAAIGIVLANILYFIIFKKDFDDLEEHIPEVKKEDEEKPDWDHRGEGVPVWITLVHVLMLLWTVVTAHYPPLFIGGFLFSLGFMQATAHHQNRLDLKPPLLVGFFLAGLVIHGGVQAWWIAPILGSLGEVPLMLGATFLTAFNDNAAITYLSTLVPNFSDSLKYAVVAGAVTGGGLTVIANAPNPAGQSILSRHFEDGVSPLKLAMAAFVPTIIMGCCFMLL